MSFDFICNSNLASTQSISLPSLTGGNLGGTTGDNNIMFLKSVVKVSTRLKSYYQSRPATSFYPDLIIASQTKIALNKFNLLFF